MKGPIMARQFGGVALLLLLVAATTTAAPFLVDINERTTVVSPPGGAGPSPTQSGWVGMTLTGATGVSSDFGTLDISFVPIVGASLVLDDRDRGQLGGGAYPLSDLLREVVYITGNPAIQGNGTFDVVVSGLNSGQYLFNGYFHDNSVNHIAMDVELSVDSGGSFVQVVDDALASTGTNPVTVGHAFFPFTANGSDTVQFRIIGQGGTVGFPTSETAILNGFTIEPFTTLGDFNVSGTVEVNDFYILSNNLGTHLDGNFVGHAGGDINLDGRVDLDDFGMFKALFPQVAAAAEAVPEPTTMALASLVVFGGAISRRRPRLHF